MANYNLTINSKFKPYTFDELIKPYELYKKEFDTQQAALNDLQVKAGIFESIANEQSDPVAYARYKAYSDNLNNQVEALMTSGLNSGTKQALMGLKADYSRRITPIEQAYAARQKQAEQQQQALLQDDSLMFNRDAATTSLDDYLYNPQLQYKVASGNKIMARVQTAAKNLAKELQDNPNKMIPLVGKDYYEYVKKRGFTSEAILAAIQDNENASPVLKGILDAAVQASGINTWNNRDALNSAYQYAKLGLWDAVGDTETQLMDNWRAKENLSYAHSMSLQHDRQQHERSMQKNDIRTVISPDGSITGYMDKEGRAVDANGNVYSDGQLHAPNTTTTNTTTNTETKTQNKPTQKNPSSTTKTTSPTAPPKTLAQQRKEAAIAAHNKGEVTQEELATKRPVVGGMYLITSSVSGKPMLIYKNGKIIDTKQRNKQLSVRSKIEKNNKVIEENIKNKTNNMVPYPEVLALDTYRNMWANKWDFRDLGGSGFSESDAEIMDKRDITREYNKNILRTIAESYGVNQDDIMVYRDEDHFSDNHYRVVFTGAGVKGSLSSNNSADDSETGGM